MAKLPPCPEPDRNTSPFSWQGPPADIGLGDRRGGAARCEPEDCCAPYFEYPPFSKEFMEPGGECSSH